MMTPKDIILKYFECLNKKEGWDSLLSDDLSFTSPTQHLCGKAAYIQDNKDFFNMVTSIEVKDLIVDGNKVCAITSYEIQFPKGTVYKDNGVAEIFSVKNNKIISLAIYFDTAAYITFRDKDKQLLL